MKTMIEHSTILGYTMKQKFRPFFNIIKTSQIVTCTAPGAPPKVADPRALFEPN